LALLTVAILYFGSAWAKLVFGSGGVAWEWMSPGNLARWTISSLIYWEPPTPLGELMLRSRVLLSAAAVGTVVLEAGLLVVVLLGLPITPVVVGLLGMHTVITLSLGPFFFDQYVFLALFIPWDAAYRRVAPTREAVVVYDGHRSVCVGSLYPFKLLDTNEVVRFYPQTDVPHRYRRRGSDGFESEFHLFEDGVEHAGYFAFRELIWRYPLLGPVARLMGWPPIETIGTAVYGHIAGGRGRCFVRPIDEDADPLPDSNRG
jgi:hypothetical protein